jgi:hypothetical protein
MSAQLMRPGEDAAPVDWALYFASHGLRILPVRARSKEPRLKDWPNKATTDPEQITAWFTRWPDGNYGICTAGLAVTDIDPGKGGHLWLDSNEQHLPDTWRFKTGSGGWHLIYRAPTDHAVGNRTGIAPGVDIRGNGGQIVGPGSIHPNGTLYEMMAGPEDCDLAVAPACVMKLINGTSPPSTSSEDIGDDPFLAYGRAHGGGEDDPAAALNQACAAIQAAPVGQQEVTLNNSAIRMARLIEVRG